MVRPRRYCAWVAISLGDRSIDCPLLECYGLPSFAVVKSALSRIAALVPLLAVSVISLRASGVSRPSPRFDQQASDQPQPVRSRVADPVSFAPVVTRYCVGCHNERVRSGSLALDSLRWDDAGASAPVWEKIIQKLRNAEMPPPGRPRPDKATYDAFRASLEAALDAEAARHPNPGRPAIHRLNRVEYANAIRDLLDFPVDGRSLLPLDDTAFGFDNNADVLSVSPGLLERYMSAARRISRLAIGDRTLRPVAETYSLSDLIAQDERSSEDLPFGTRGGVAVSHYFPLDAEYTLKIRLQRDKAGTGAVRGLAAAQQIDVHLGGERLKRFTVGAEAPGGRVAKPETADAGLELKFAARAGSSLVGVSILDRTLATEGVNPTRLPVWTFSPGNDRVSIDSVEIEGPFNATGSGDTPSRRRIFVCMPSARAETACATAIVTALARRAYRRPVTGRDTERLLRFYSAAREDGDFESGIRAALESILVDPEFLFRIERDPPGIAPGTAYRLSDLELASRLSFFLWSSIPDEELLALAERGGLGDRAVLEHQVRRMLADRRSSALVENFGQQWLHIRSLRGVTPDVNAFPEFDDNLRAAFERETLLFLDSQLRNDRPIPEVLTANYTFVNERLARHYGIPNVYGGRFRRVVLSGQRGGLLGEGSILTVTSHATRTSPVLRGKWVLENLLGAPPPPPPANVPPLKENTAGDQASTVRERLEEHRNNPVCASCHARMDPIGFALEQFDAIGRWRDTDGPAPIDASATLPDGTKFSGAAELRALLASRRDDFVTTVIDKLLVYAVGRGVEYYDRPIIRRILKDTRDAEYRWSSVILNIVESEPFRMRRSDP
jgi:mono/diheme cytochrome c family protein